MLNGVYTSELIGQYRQVSAVLPLENSRRPKRNRRFAYGRRELPSPCYAASHQQDGRRVDFRPKLADQVSHFRNAIPLIRIRAYTFLYDETTASYSNGEMFTLELRQRRLTKCLRSSAFYRKPPRGGPGIPGFPQSSSVDRVHMYLALYRLFLKDDFCH